MSQSVGTAGGTVTLSDGAKLVIPAGALGTTQTITVTAGGTVPPGYTGYSPVYEFGPAGLHFDMPVAVTLPFHAGATNPAVYWSRETGAGFDELGGTVAANAITAMVTHFSQGFVAQAGGPTGDTDGGAGMGAGTGGGSDAAAGTTGTAGTTGIAGTTGAAGTTGTAGTTGAAGAGTCMIGTSYVDYKPFVGTTAPAGTSLAGASSVKLSADGTVHFNGSTLFSAMDGKTFKPNDQQNARGSFIFDTAGNWIYFGSQDPMTSKYTVMRFPTTGGCPQRVYTFTDDVYQPVALGVTGEDVVFSAVIKTPGSTQPTVYVGAKGTAWTSSTSKIMAAFTATNGALSPSNHKHIWVAGSGSPLGLVAASLDGGATFVGRSVPSGTILTGQGSAVVTPDPVNDMVAYAVTTGAAAGLYKTTDGGMNWNQSDKIAPPTGEGISQIQLGADGTIYARTQGAGGMGGGFYKRAPGATTWTAMNGDLTAAEIPLASFALRENATGPATIIRLAASGFVWRSDDGGATYTKVPVVGLPALTAFEVGTDPDAAMTFYVNDRTNHVWKTTDAGKTFAPTAVGYTGRPYVLPGGDLLLVGASDGDNQPAMFHSADGGATFAPAGTGLPVGYQFQMNLDAPSALIVGKAAKTAYMMYGIGGGDTANRGKLFVTTDGGLNWTAGAMFTPAADSGQGFVVADPATAKRLYRFSTGNFNAPTQFSISTDNGTTWTDAAMPTPAQQGFNAQVMYSNVAIDRTGRLFLSLFQEHFSLPPGTTTWQKVTVTGNMDFHVVGNYVYSGFSRSSDGGATFKSVTAISDLTFDYQFANGAFAHRADPTLWIGDASADPLGSRGLIVGHMP